MLKRIKNWGRKRQKIKKEEIAALMACILRDKTNEQSWIAKDIEPEYVEAFIYIMKGKWRKALNLVSQIKYKPPEPINCHGEDPNDLVGNFLIKKLHEEE